MKRRPTIKTVDRGKSYDRRTYKIYEGVSEDENLSDVSDEEDPIEEVKQQNKKLQRKLEECRKSIRKSKLFCDLKF